MWHSIRVEITGSKQGLFHGNDPKGAPGPIACFKVGLSAKKKNDAGRAGAVHSSATASLNKPLKLRLAWGPSAPQCWDAYWSNEVLSTVNIVACYADGSGTTDVPFKKITLTNAVIVGITQNLDTPDDAVTMDVAVREGKPIFGEVNLRIRYEQILVEHPESQTQAHHGSAMPSVPALLG